MIFVALASFMKGTKLSMFAACITLSFQLYVLSIIILV